MLEDYAYKTQTDHQSCINRQYKKCKFGNIKSMIICFNILEQLQNIWPGNPPILHVKRCILREC